MKYHARIIVDASYCPYTGASAYAAWITLRGQSHKIEHIIDSLGVCPDNNTAERKAIEQMIGAMDDRGICKFLILTDSQTSIENLYTNGVKANQKLIVHLRHIKGHAKTIAMDHQAQRWCDAAAKERMRHHRSAIVHQEYNNPSTHKMDFEGLKRQQNDEILEAMTA